jgi:twitching motility two-component system response regulator PilH
MDPRQRWAENNRRSSDECRKYDDPHYTGPERRSRQDRQVRKRSTLLLVDSSPTFLFYMGMLLKKLEYEVRTATTAEDALKFMDIFLPSLVITDTALPGMSGIDLVKQMRNDPLLQSIPVIFHSAETNPDVLTACKKEGAADFFMKPVQPEPLYQAIQAATEAMPRQMIRIDTSLPVEVRDAVRTERIARKELVTTLSEGGCYIKTLVPEPVNTVVAITISMQDRHVTATATVLTSLDKAGGKQKDPGMAVKFLTISKDDKKVVREFIKEHILKDLSVPK